MTSASYGYRQGGLGSLKTYLIDNLTRVNIHQLAVLFEFPIAQVEKLEQLTLPGSEFVQYLDEKDILNKEDISRLLLALREKGIHKIAKEVERRFKAFPNNINNSPTPSNINNSPVAETNIARNDEPNFTTCILQLNEEILNEKLKDFRYYCAENGLSRKDVQDADFKTCVRHLQDKLVIKPPNEITFLITALNAIGMNYLANTLQRFINHP